MALYCGEVQEKVSKYCVLRYGIILWGGTGDKIKILCIGIWHYTVGWGRRIYQNIVYLGMVLYSGEGQEKVSKYFVLRYGNILRAGKGESIKLLCIMIWHYTADRDRRMNQNILY
jgi:hypothetical protein